MSEQSKNIPYSGRYKLSYLQFNHCRLWETIYKFLSFTLFYSLPLCPTFAPSGQPSNNPLNSKTICLNKCFDPHCEKRNSSHWCDGIVSCYWCQKDKSGRQLEKPYCANSERCFRGIEFATYDRKSICLIDLSYPYLLRSLLQRS